VNRGTTGVNSLPKTVTRQRRGGDLNTDPSAPESSTLTTQLPSQPVIDQRTKLLMKKYVVVRKLEKVVVVSGSQGLQKAELQDLQLGVVM